MNVAKNIEPILDWLTVEAKRCDGPPELLDGYCRKLRAHGVPIDRSTLGAPLLHPIAQSSYVFWNHEDGSSQRWFVWTPQALETLRASPIYLLYEKGENVTLDLNNEEDLQRFPIGVDLKSEGFEQYLAIAIPFSDGSNKAFTAATRAPGGFTSDQIDILHETLPLLTLVYEGFIAKRTAQTLMETFVGQRAGLEVLNGNIARGDGAYIDAVIWFSDLRGFTDLGSRLNSSELLGLLNQYLSTVTEAVEQNGGEVLKYIGDAVLAIFPVGENASDAIASAETAAFHALHANPDNPHEMAFGIALHRGEVFYGNIGGGSRLDFTVIGSAVNQTSRIEALCKTLNQELLISDAVKLNSQREWQSCGEHILKGISEKVEVFGRPAL